MTEPTSDDNQKLSGPDAGLSRTGRTADDFDPGDRTASDYSSPGGLDRQDDEEA
jgi:hypothetical protein